MRALFIPKHHLFLAPHPDDAIGSCGLTIINLREFGREVSVYTMFSGNAQPPFSTFARQLHRQWNAAAHLPTLRRREERAAVARAGARLRFARETDAIYRRDDLGNWLYPNEDALFSTVCPADEHLFDLFIKRVRTMANPRDCRLYAPLAVGMHIDHQIGFGVGCALASLGFEVWFYEDFHYAYDQSKYRNRLLALKGWTSVVAEADPGCLEAKIEAFDCYTTQIPFLFGNSAVMRKIFTKFALITSSLPGMVAERFWIKP